MATQAAKDTAPAPETANETARKETVTTRERCPRCRSENTKFCYYNNYCMAQPRYFCRGCRRYWTKGGTLRNVPPGGNRHRNANDKRSCISSCGEARERTKQFSKRKKAAKVETFAGSPGTPPMVPPTAPAPEASSSEAECSSYVCGGAIGEEMLLLESHRSLTSLLTAGAGDGNGGDVEVRMAPPAPPLLPHISALLSCSSSSFGYSAEFGGDAFR